MVRKYPMMVNIGKRTVYFTGSKCRLTTTVWEHENGKQFFASWHGAKAEIFQIDGDATASAGWVTKEPY